MLEPSWLGRRVSVRRVLDHGESASALGDVVGELAGLTDGSAVVASRTGLVEVPLDRVVAARLVPPSTADELALEAVAARSWRPAESAELGGWRLRANDGFSRRANSVLPLRQPGMPLGDALERAEEWYATRGLPLLIQVPIESRRLLDAELGERGWSIDAPTRVLVARLTGSPAPEDVTVDLAAEPDDAWLELCRGGAATDLSARALLTRHDRVVFASVRLDGATIATGRGTVDDDWLAVTAVEVAPPHRRERLATAIVAALHRWGADGGAQRAHAAVHLDNTAGSALFDHLGYWPHHEYHYRRSPERP